MNSNGIFLIQHVLEGGQHCVGIGAAAEQQGDDVRSLHLASRVEDGACLDTVWKLESLFASEGNPIYGS
jgi:hypothetical protein